MHLCFIMVHNFANMMRKEPKQEMEEYLEERNHCILKLLVRTRLDMEPEFSSGRRKKSYLWGKVLEEMKEHMEVPLTKDQITRKFLNLMTTYKRIKQRANLSSCVKTTWEHFDDFEEVYGNRMIINQTPTELLSMEYSGEESVEEAVHINNDEPSCSNKKSKAKPSSEMLEFLKEQAISEQARHDEIIALEREKLRTEERRIAAIQELTDVLFFKYIYNLNE